MFFFLYLFCNVIQLIFVLQCYSTYICVAMLFILHLVYNVVLLVHVLLCFVEVPVSK